VQLFLYCGFLIDAFQSKILLSSFSLKGTLDTVKTGKKIIKKSG
jgi:hypothetical protein